LVSHGGDPGTFCLFSDTASQGPQIWFPFRQILGVPASVLYYNLIKQYRFTHSFKHMNKNPMKVASENTHMNNRHMNNQFKINIIIKEDEK
jgi:hypothetical protein